LTSTKRTRGTRPDALPTAADRSPGRDQLLKLYQTMVRIRRFDERTIELFLAGAIKGTAHSCVGQEAIAAGACAALLPDDFVVSHHRGHGHCIAKGADPKRMMAELMARSTGYCGGLGGSMHIAALELNILGANGIVGAGIGIGTGAALAARMRKLGQVGIAFFGDGAANEGIFHEALNLASLWKLPIIYLCENNLYGLSTAMHESTAIARIADRAASYSMPGLTVDGNDVEAVHAAVAQAVARARAGDGPTLIEALTYRWGDHSMRANLPRYRLEGEEKNWREKDPIQRLANRLGRDFGASAETLELIIEEANAEIEDAIAFAKGSPEPDMTQLAAAVCAPIAQVPEPRSGGERELSMVEAINEALHQEMAADERVFAIGEDIGKIGGIFVVTRGLLDRFGPERILDTPISESVIGLASVGAAISGFRPVVEVQLFDLVTLMMDATVNQAAKFRFMLGGKPSVPIVFRGPQGGGVRLAAQHSQSLEAWFSHVPGLIVLAPSNPHDAKGLLASAIRDDNPVVFIEHKLLYLAARAPVPTERYAIPIGKASVRRSGNDITLVATLAMVEPALAAARALEAEGIDVEVIDPRTLRPLDEVTILRSVKKTGRLVIAHEGWKSGGFGAEVSALVAEQAIDWMEGPIMRIGAPETPMPYNDKLERASIPSQRSMVDVIRALVRRDEVQA